MVFYLLINLLMSRHLIMTWLGATLRSWLYSRLRPPRTAPRRHRDTRGLGARHNRVLNVWTLSLTWGKARHGGESNSKILCRSLRYFFGVSKNSQLPLLASFLVWMASFATLYIYNGKFHAHRDFGVMDFPIAWASGRPYGCQPDARRSRRRSSQKYNKILD
jgi:hypothetical protein